MAETRQAVVKGAAEIMPAIEAMARHEPEKITPDLAQELHW